MIIFSITPQMSDLLVILFFVVHYKQLNICRELNSLPPVKTGDDKFVEAQEKRELERMMIVREHQMREIALVKAEIAVLKRKDRQQVALNVGPSPVRSGTAPGGRRPQPLNGVNSTDDKENKGQLVADGNSAGQQNPNPPKKQRPKSSVPRRPVAPVQSF